MSSNNTMFVLGLLLIINLSLFSHIVASEEKVFESIRNETTSTSWGSGKWRSECPHAQIQITQGQINYKGIPRFTVTITNLCTNCFVARVHLHCGWFASANVVNPNNFKRLKYDDCLVYGGRPIRSGKIIEFQYSNARPYPLSVASFVCSYY